MPFFDSALFLLGQSAEDLAKIPAQLHMRRVPPNFRDEHDVVSAVPFCVIWAFLVVH
jgi:hypothetical protein